MTTFTINAKTTTVDLPGDTPLLWVIREHLKLTGTKYGCGISQCGACTVLLNGSAIRSCARPLSSVEGAEIITIEGLHPDAPSWAPNSAASAAIASLVRSCRRLIC